MLMATDQKQQKS